MTVAERRERKNSRARVRVRVCAHVLGLLPAADRGSALGYWGRHCAAGDHVCSVASERP